MLLNFNFYVYIIYDIDVLYEILFEERILLLKIRKFFNFMMKQRVQEGKRFVQGYIGSRAGVRIQGFCFLGWSLLCYIRNVQFLFFLWRDGSLVLFQRCFYVSLGFYGFLDFGMSIFIIYFFCNSVRKFFRYYLIYKEIEVLGVCLVLCF